MEYDWTPTIQSYSFLNILIINNIYLIKKIYPFIVVNIYSFKCIKKLSIEFSLGQQTVKKDIGFNYKIGAGYKLNEKGSFSAYFGKSEIKNKDLNVKYTLTTYELNYNYGIITAKNSNFQSIMGVSYF
ncbi:hypothetical protein [Lutibacter sp.]